MSLGRLALSVGAAIKKLSDQKGSIGRTAICVRELHLLGGILAVASVCFCLGCLIGIQVRSSQVARMLLGSVRAAVAGCSCA